MMPAMLRHSGYIAGELLALKFSCRPARRGIAVSAGARLSTAPEQKPTCTAAQLSRNPASSSSDSQLGKAIPRFTLEIAL
jgi:hypothetical protein